MDETLNVELLGGLSNSASTIDVNLRHGEVASVELATGKIDDDVGVLHGLPDGRLVTNVPLHGYDLTKVTHDLEVGVDLFLTAVRDDDLRANTT